MSHLSFGRLAVRLIGLCALFLSILAAVPQAAPHHAAAASATAVPAAPLAVPEPVADVSIHGSWVLHNNTVFWDYNGGDIGTYFSALRSKSVNGGATQNLLDLDGQNRLKQIQVDNVAFFTWNDVDNRIEKRSRQNPLMTPVVLFTFSDTQPPIDFVIDDTTGPAGNVIYASPNRRITRVDKYGATSAVLATMSAAVRDLDVDALYIWIATADGVYRIDRSCETACTPVRVQSASATRLHGASAGGRQAVFFVTETVPPRVESWDCGIPGQSGCYHKTLYTPSRSDMGIYSLIATPTHVWWTEGVVPDTATYQLRRAPRAGGSMEIMALLDGSLVYGGPLALDDQYIYFRHSGVSRIPLDSTPIVFNFSFMGSEITQGIQNMSGNVILQERMPTYLILYVKQTSGPDVGRVEVELAGSRQGTPLPGSPVRTVGALTPGTADLTQPRQDVPRITVRLPDEWLSVGVSVLNIKVDPRLIYDQTPATRIHNAAFEWQPPICIKGIRVKVHGPDIALNDGSLAYAVGQAKRLLPTRDIRLYFDWEPLEEGLWPFYSPYELPSDDWKVMANLWWRDRFSDDPDSCDNDDARTLYLGGYARNFDPGFNGMAALGLDQLQVRMPDAQPIWPVPYRDATLAHEIGHNFGREHVDCGDPDDPDSNYPYPSCWFGVPDGINTYYGYYAPSDRLISPVTAADLMSYGYPRWPSDWTWNRIESAIEDGMALAPWRAAALQDLQSAAAAAAPDAPATAAGVYLTGWIDTATNTGALDPVFTIPATAMSAGMQRKWAASLAEQSTAAPEDAAVIYRVRFIRAGGTAVASYDVPLIRLDGRLSATQMPFALTVPAPSQTYLSIQLVADSVVLASRSGFSVPVVAVTAPAAGAVVSGNLTVNWTASDNSALTFIVQYSPNAGGNWYTLANGAQGPAAATDYSATYSALGVPGSAANQARVRVIATDGYLTAIAQSAAFTLTQRPPNPYIVEPAGGARYTAGQTVTLAGGATDPEDDALGASLLAWRIGSTNYGTGFTRSVAGLAPGSYTVRLTATDSGLAYGVEAADAPHAVSSTAFTESSFAVDPVTAPSGAAVLDGRCSDAGYGQVTPLPLSPYGDGAFGYAALLRNDRYLWICFDGLRKQGAGSPGAFVGVRIDPNNSRDAWAQTTDYGFFIRQSDGVLQVKQGNGSGGFGDDAPAFVSSAFDARLSDRGTTWSAELRLDLGFLRASLSWQDVMGLDFGHYWVDAQGNDFHWPHAAQYNRPNTWAVSVFRRVPQLQQISPTAATVGAAAFTLTLSGSGLQNGDTAFLGSTLLATTYVSSTRVTAVVPTSALQTAGELAVTLRSSESTAVFSPPLPFTVFNRIPALTSLSPTHNSRQEGAAPEGVVADLTLTVNGSGFVSGAAVDFDGVALATTFVNSTRLTAVVPQALLSAARTVQVVAYNPSPTQGVSNALPFQVVVTPPTAVGLAGQTAVAATAPFVLWSAVAALALLTLAALPRKR